MNVRTLGRKAPFAFLLSAITFSSSAHAYRYFTDPRWYCSDAPLYIDNHEQLVPRCAGATPGTRSLQAGAVEGDTAASAIWQWAVLGPPWIIWLDRNSCTNAAPSADGVDLVWLASDNGAVNGTTVGLTTPQSVVCSPGTGWDPCVEEFDIELGTSQTSMRQTSCRDVPYTREGTWSHETGHAYQLDHFDDWISTMNTSQDDLTTCRADHSVRPSSDAQQGLVNQPEYPMPSALDVGGSNAFQIAGCGLANTDCYTRDQVTVNVNSYTPSPHSNTVRFTSMNLRNALPTNNLRVRLRMQPRSTETVGATGFDLGDWILGPAHAGAVYDYNIGYSFNISQLPVGVEYCVMVIFDPLGSLSEFDETDNVLPTAKCFRRTF